MARVKKTSSILIPKESFMHLNKRCSMERKGCVETEEIYEKRWDGALKVNGKQRVMDGSYGGYLENPKKGLYVSWSVDDVKKILDEAGLPFDGMGLLRKR